MPTPPNMATDPESVLGIPGVDHPDAAEVAGREAPKALSRDLNVEREARAITFSLKALFGNKRRVPTEAVLRIIRGEIPSAQEAQFKDPNWLAGYVKGWMDALD